jgi:hypothetical protein
VDLVARWWNGERDRVARRDIWLTSDGRRWAVRALHGAADDREVHREFAREYEARAMVDRLIAAAPGRWKDITRLVRTPPTAAMGESPSVSAASADHDDSAQQIPVFDQPLPVHAAGPADAPPSHDASTG